MAKSEEFDPFSDAGSVGAQYPSLADLKGQFVVVIPTRYEREFYPANAQGKKGDRVTADIVFLDTDHVFTTRTDGEGNVTELDAPIAAGEIMKDFYVSGAVLCPQLRPFVTNDGSRPVLGVITKLPPKQKGHKGVWSLKALDREGALVPAYTEAQKAIAMEWWKNKPVEDPFE